jgi:hypothetical protein
VSAGDPEDASGRVSPRESGDAPVGVRPSPGSLEGDAGRLRWVDPGSLTLSFGDRVAVGDGAGDGGREWLGEVVIPPERLVEWPANLSGLPVVVRRASDAEWPSLPTTDGRRLLDSLGLPSALLVRGGPPSALGPRSANPGRGAGVPAQHERADQQPG